MKFNDEQLGFIYRFKDKMRPSDMGRVLGSSGKRVADEIFRMRSVKEDKYPMSKQEDLALEHMRVSFDDEILAFEYAFDKCLDLPGGHTLRKGFL